MDNGHLNYRTESWFDHGVDHGIEYRFPLLDRRVVEFALGCPPWIFFKNGWKRYGFRRISEGLLPPDAQWRKLKSDPATVRGTRPLWERAMELIAERARARRAEIEEAGLIDFERLISGLQNNDNTPEAAATKNVAWLAFATGRLRT